MYVYIKTQISVIAFFFIPYTSLDEKVFFRAKQNNSKKSISKFIKWPWEKDIDWYFDISLNPTYNK